MRVRIDSLELSGTSRSVTFRPGLNVITGEIATGKTTLLRLCKSLFGASLSGLAPEVFDRSVNLRAQVVIGSTEYRILRPLTTSSMAQIEIAGGGSALRLPFDPKGDRYAASYKDWLLEVMDLPRLTVPSAPTRPDSDPSPVTISDYLQYCDLTESEIDDSVFGHHYFYKDIKRKYVFEIVYGKYTIRAASLQERLREISSELAASRADDAVLAKILAATPWENRAELDRQIAEAHDMIAGLDQSVIQLSHQITSKTQTGQLRERIQKLEQQTADLEVARERESGSVSRLEELLAQLRTQAERLARSIVAGSLLVDFEFVQCPRCGANVASREADGSICKLCLQLPAQSYTREALIQEQERVENQIRETLELITERRERIIALDQAVQQHSAERATVAGELDLQTRSYVSDEASEMTRQAELRTQARERLARLQDYLGLFERWDQTRLQIGALEREKQELEEQLKGIEGLNDTVRERIAGLNRRFASILEEFNVPRFDTTEPISYIHPSTYLPVLYGRRFDDLSSQGFKVMVNVAHVLAHQLTAIANELPLPNILFIDGLTSNIGHREGLDSERVAAIYQYLIDLSNQLGHTLQVIVADHDVPDNAREFLVAEFSQEHRFVPEPDGG